MPLLAATALFPLVQGTSFLPFCAWLLLDAWPPSPAERSWRMLAPPQGITVPVRAGPWETVRAPSVDPAPERRPA